MLIKTHLRWNVLLLLIMYIVRIIHNTLFGYMNEHFPVRSLLFRNLGLRCTNLTGIHNMYYYYYNYWMVIL